MELIKISEVVDRSITVTLANPPLNILNNQMINELTELMKGLESDSSINCILLNGDGKCFSAGADIKEHMPEHVETMLTSFGNLLKSIINHPKIIISAVHGYVYGGAFELMLASDFCLSASDAKFSLPEIKLGVFPPIATAWLPMMIGYKNANKLCFTGCELSAEVLKQMGIVNHIVDPSELLRYSREFCKKFADFTCVALSHGKKSMGIFKKVLSDSLDYSIKEYLGELMKASDPIEGLQAFIEKRRAEWRYV